MQERDLEKLVDHFADKLKWEIPGNTEHIKWLGVRKNKQEVELFFKLLWKETLPISTEIHNIIFENNEVMMKGKFTTKMLRTDKVITSIFFIHFIVCDSKIVEYTLMEDSYAVSNALELDINGIFG